MFRKREGNSNYLVTKYSQSLASPLPLLLVASLNTLMIHQGFGLDLLVSVGVFTPIPSKIQPSGFSLEMLNC